MVERQSGLPSVPWDWLKLRVKARNHTSRSLRETWNPFRPLNWDRLPRQGTSQAENPSDLELGPTDSRRNARGTSVQPEDQSVMPIRESDEDDLGSPRRDTIDGSGGIAPNQRMSDGRPPSRTEAEVGNDNAAVESDRDNTSVRSTKLPWYMRLLGIQPAKHHSPFTAVNQLQRTLLRAPINVLLICFPIGMAWGILWPNTVLTFGLNWAAAIPLFSLAEAAIEEISLRIDETPAGFLYLTTCNLVQLISCILLLVNHQTEILKLTLTGSILANLLFTLGLSLAVGGQGRLYQYFNPIVAHVSANVLTLAATSVVIPTTTSLLAQVTEDGIKKQSRGASVILILVYIFYLWYQWRTHREVFQDEAEKAPLDPRSNRKHQAHHAGSIFVLGIDDLDQQQQRQQMQTQQPLQPIMRRASIASALPGARRRHTMQVETKWDLLHAPPQSSYQPHQENLDTDELEPKLHGLVALAVFVVATAGLYFSVEFVVNSIEALTEDAGVSRTFVGLILFPIPNADFAPITYAIRDRMDVTMNYTIGKCLQTALFITPLTALMAWGIGPDPDDPGNPERAEFTLAFDGFQVVSLFASVFMLNFLIITGRAGWIQGVLLLGEWLLFAIAAYFVSSTVVVDPA